ncbi:myosin light chain kinase 3 [Pseudorasbora parva]|uniref:myosin light chain kinase 3 n=1 Tax=Pseudorasbora parva TaxID=51549 RepID=UPI00351DC777
MSKQATLATCIAKMYEGSRLEKSGTPSGTVKKPSPTLIGSLSNVEVKLNNLEGKVGQIELTQMEVLHKLSLLCQGMEALERSLMQHKQGAQESNVINGQRESKLPLLTEVRSLCGETVDLLQDLKHDSQQQRKKIESMESSLSTLEKVIGYVGNAFRNSKIVEFILSGVVPWRRQGLLDTVEEEKNKPDDNSIKPNDSYCHQSTQTSEEVKEVIPAATELLQPEVTVPTDPSSLPSPEAPRGASETLVPVSREERSKALRKAKEVTLKSRAPAQVQTFAPEVQLEAEDIDVYCVPKQETDSSTATTANAESVTLTTTKVEKDLSLQPSAQRTLEQADASQDGDRASLESIVNGQQEEPKVEVPQKQTEVSQVGDKALLKPLNIEQQQQQQQQQEKKVDVHFKTHFNKDTEVKSQHEDTVEMVTPVPKHDERKTGSEPDIKKIENKTAEKILESDPIKNCAAHSPQNTTVVEEEKAKSALLRKSESQLLIIDDCPPLPAPFEHRIVSAKQVPMNSYYAVNPNDVLGGGRFGQVHKCAELSSGLMLAAKIIKVRGMKERTKGADVRFFVHKENVDEARTTWEVKRLLFGQRCVRRARICRILDLTTQKKDCSGAAHLCEHD